MNANNVASVLVKQDIWRFIKEFILERSLMDANSVASVSLKDEI